MQKSKLIGAGLVGAAILALTGVAAAQAQNKQCDPDCTKACCVDGKASQKQAGAVIGESAPDFTLVDIEGNEVTLSDYTADGKIVVLEWFNPSCPFVAKHHDTFATMKETIAEFEGKDVVWLAINSANEGHKTGYLALNRERQEEWKIGYPILIDTSGEVGKAYGAKTTPHMFVIDADGILAYAGAIDSDQSAKKLGEENYVYNAVSALLNGETVEVSKTKSYGCSVKY